MGTGDGEIRDPIAGQIEGSVEAFAAGYAAAMRICDVARSRRPRAAVATRADRALGEPAREPRRRAGRAGVRLRPGAKARRAPGATAARTNAFAEEVPMECPARSRTAESACALRDGAWRWRLPDPRSAS